MPVIGINAQLLSARSGYRRAGIHHYIAQVLAHLPAVDGWRYVVFSQAGAELAAFPQLHLRPSHWPVERRLARIAWEQLAWPWLARRGRVDLLHSMAFALPRLSRLPAVVTVYDLSFMVYPHRFPLFQRFYLRWQTARACRQARRVLTISQASRADIHRYFGVPLQRIDVVYPGVDPAFRPLPPDVVAAFRREKGLPRLTILHVGTLQPRKNIPLLVQAFAQLRRMDQFRQADLQLVLVGGKGWLYREIFDQVEASDLQGQVRFAGYVPDAELPLWYNAGSLLVFPSLYEGFGMPVVQAMACGTPVLAANGSAVPEAAGRAALLFEPHDVDALAKGMAAVLATPEQAGTMRQEGLRQSQQFSWAQAGQQLYAVYQRALSQP